MKKYQKLDRYPLGSVTADGFLKEQLLRNKHGMGGHLDELEPGMIADPFIQKSYVPQWGDGDQSGWGAEISGNYWTGLIELAFTLQDEQLIAKVTDWVDGMLRHRRADGYLGTYYEPDAKIYEDYNAWGTACAMRGLIAFYEVTRRQDVLDAVHECMLWFTRTWAGDKKTSYAGAYIIEPMIFCYYYTGDERLVTFAREYAEYLCDHDIFSISYKSFLEKGLQFNSEHTAGLGTQSRLPALLYTATGEEKYLRATEKILDEVYARATHLSGSPVSVSEYLAPVSSVAETEYCSYAFFNATYSYLSYITGKSKYGDRMEEMFYNGAQGARKKDERAIAYLSSPNQVYATDVSSFSQMDMQVYAPCYPVSCCPVNSVAVLGEFVRGMYLHDGVGNIFVTVYGPSTLRTDGFTLRQKTLYPFRDTVTLEMQGEKDCTVFLRIPAWCQSYTVTVNGSPVTAEKGENGYAGILRHWQTGDELTVTFAMETKVVRVDDSMASKKYPISILRGPLLYALHIPENWVEYPGRPATPLPEGWHWYKVLPQFTEAEVHDPHDMLGLRRNQISWNVALSEALQPGDITVREQPVTGYVWENPPITLQLTGYKAPYLCAPYPMTTFEPFGDKQPVTDPVPLTLVPYGCTNLRISYFPVAKL